MMYFVSSRGCYPPGETVRHGSVEPCFKTWTDIAARLTVLAGYACNISVAKVLLGLKPELLKTCKWYSNKPFLIKHNFLTTYQNSANIVLHKSEYERLAIVNFTEY